MPSETVVVSQTNALQSALATTGDRLGSTLTDTFEEFMRRGFTDRKDIAAWVDGTIPAVRAAGFKAASLSEGYSALMAGRPAVAATAADYSLLVGFDEPYLRLWHALSQGTQFDDAVIAAQSVTVSLGVDAVQQASRHQMRMSGTSTKWRRVLTGSENCKWCATVSTQLYLSADSATFGHKHCDCTVVEVVGDSESDALDALMEDRYRALKAAGIIDEMSRGRASRRVRQAETSASRSRDETLANAVAETDPTLRRSLLEQAKRWDDQARAAHAKAAELAAGI